MNFSQYSKELHKPVIRKFQRRVVIANYRDNIWGADIVDFSDYEQFNYGYKYILCVIDVFSKFAWCVPLQDKSSQTVLKAFKEIIRTSKRKPEHLWVDEGTEFYNKLFEAFLKSQDISMYSTYGEHKSVIVERFNRTLKGYIWKYFSTISNANWKDFLPQILHFYNNEKIHRSIKMTPFEASKPENREKVYNNLYYKKYQKMANTAPTKPKFKIGDIVRISRVKDTFEKGFIDNWSKETFLISKVLNTFPITYNIKEMDGEPINGSYYEQELLKTESPDSYDIEEVLKTKTVKGKKQYFVKFIGWDKKFNKWISEDEYNRIENKPEFI
jgi:hypothetical protein